MKRFLKAIAVAIGLALALGLIACKSKDNKEPDVPPDSDIKVVAVQAELDLTSSAVFAYDYTTLFTITENGEAVTVTAEYLDRTALSDEPGEYNVTCTYGGASASVTVKVTADAVPPVDTHVYALELSEEEITLNADEVEAFDFAALFTAKVDGAKIEITAEMVTTDVRAAAGVYTYTVKNGKAEKTLTVNVWEYAKVEMIAAYRVKEVPVNELGGFDYTSLFMLYTKGKAAEVKADMISGVPSAPAVGGTYTVTASYTDGDGNSASASVKVKAVAEKTVAVSVKDVVTYPNGGVVDLTELFEVTYGGERVTVTPDMISGAIDYAKDGDSEITLDYGGKTYTATVTVVQGVIIEYAKGETVKIVTGTDKRTYPFASDFKVLINGAQYRDFDCFIDTSKVDFTKPGVYTATLRIPYSTQRPTIGGGAKFDYTEKTITYEVTDVDASVNVLAPVVELPVSTTKYGINDIKSNVTVVINGTPCNLTDNKAYANKFTVYVENKTEIDFSFKGAQTLELDVYTSGVAAAPVRVTYDIVIGSAVKVEAHDAALFEGGTLYNRDLFTITDGGKAVKVTDDMLEGKVDTFTPGVYSVSIDYEGMTATARVVVFEKHLQGTYKTTLTTLPIADDDDDGDTEDLGWGDSGVYALGSDAITSAAAVKRLGDLVIDGSSVTVNGRAATDVLGIDENTMTFTLGSDRYTMYYRDGIAVLDPENLHKMTFSDERRPLVYFSSALWDIDYTITINYGSEYVLSNTYPSYSIDTFKIKSKTDEREMWYGLKVRLAEKTAADTVYVVEWGEAKYAEDFVPDYLNKTSSLEFNGETYGFTMTSRSVGKVGKPAASDKKYAGMRFNGVVDGKAATLIADGSERYSFVVDGKTVFGSYGNDSELSNNMVYGGSDYSACRIRLNNVGDVNSKDVFSYQFTVDPTSNPGTFTLDARDKYFGLYLTKDGGMSIFLDGYGMGCVRFDTSSSGKTLLTYSVSAGEVVIKFADTLPGFTYGTGMTLYVAPLLNVLTVKTAVGIDGGTVFTNRADLITDGAIVEMPQCVFAARGDAAKAEFLDSIRVIDVNGEWGPEAKKNSSNIELQTVSFATAGFYRFAVNVTVGGAPVKNYYSLQIVKQALADKSLIKDYGAAVIAKTNALNMTEYGTVKVTVGTAVYTGVVTEATADGFVVKAYGADGAYLSGTGVKMADGVIKFTASGATPFMDYFMESGGACRVIGLTGKDIVGIVLREFSVGGQKLYTVGAAVSSVGYKAEIEIVSGDAALGANTVVKVKWTDEKGVPCERTVTIVKWGDTAAGLKE